MFNKNELRKVVRSAVKDFTHAHPKALEPRWIESVTKRVAGQIYCHYVHNKIKDGKLDEGVILTKELIEGLGSTVILDEEDTISQPVTNTGNTI